MLPPARTDILPDEPEILSPVPNINPPEELSSDDPVLISIDPLPDDAIIIVDDDVDNRAYDVPSIDIDPPNCAPETEAEAEPAPDDIDTDPPMAPDPACNDNDPP